MKAEKTVFIVEDSEIIRKMMMNTVNALDGFTTKGFSYGEEMLDALKIEEPVIIFVDFFLDADKKNRMNGEEVVPHIKSIAPNIPIVIMTGSSQKSVLESIQKLPVAHFIHKDEHDVLDQVEIAVLQLPALPKA